MGSPSVPLQLMRNQRREVGSPVKKLTGSGAGSGVGSGALDPGKSSAQASGRVGAWQWESWQGESRRFAASVDRQQIRHQFEGRHQRGFVFRGPKTLFPVRALTRFEEKRKTQEIKGLTPSPRSCLRNTYGIKHGANTLPVDCSAVEPSDQLPAPLTSRQNAGFGIE